MSAAVVVLQAVSIVHLIAQRADGRALFSPRARACEMCAAGAPHEKEARLLRLCALTDRGQRCAPGDRSRIDSLIADLDAEAPETDATGLNGCWRLVYASEAVYRSSPFFWAFRQASKAVSTPIGIPSSDVAPGDSIASAIYAITDAIPFYDVGPVVQEISGVQCIVQCSIDDNASPMDASDGAGVPDEPSDGTSDWRFTPDVPQLISKVELSIGRLFGLPAQTSIMTTTADLRQPDAAVGAAEGRQLDLEVEVQTTSAAQSSIASLLPLLGGLFENFPSGRALDMLAPGSSTVHLTTSYLSEGLRISRPVLEGVDEKQAVFVYARDDATW